MKNRKSTFIIYIDHFDDILGNVRIDDMKLNIDPTNRDGGVGRPIKKDVKIPYEYEDKNNEGIQEEKGSRPQNFENGEVIIKE